LNEGGSKGNAYGFTLSSLSKLPDTRSTDLSMTLAQYVVSLLTKNDTELLTFDEELPHCESASKIALSILTGELNTLTKDFEGVAKSVEEIKTTTKSDKFQKKMLKFVKDAKEDLLIMNHKYNESNDQFQKVATFFGEDSKKTDPEQLFGSVNQFIKIIKQATKDSEQQEADKEKARKREVAKAKRAKEIEEKRKGFGEMPEGHDDTIDELFSNIEDGQVFRNRRLGRKKGKTTDLFVARQEERVREKPLPLPKKKVVIDTDSGSE